MAVLDPMAASALQAAWAAAHAAEAQVWASWAAALSNAAVVILVGTLTLRSEGRTRRRRLRAAAVSILHACEVGLTTFNALRQDRPADRFDPRPFLGYIESAHVVLSSIAPQDFEHEDLAEIALNTRTLFSSLLIETRAVIETGATFTNGAWLTAHLRAEWNIRSLMEAALLFRQNRLQGSGPDIAQQAILAASIAGAPRPADKVGSAA